MTENSDLISGERGGSVQMHLARLPGNQSDRGPYRGARAPVALGVSLSYPNNKTQQVP